MRYVACATAACILWTQYTYVLVAGSPRRQGGARESRAEESEAKSAGVSHCKGTCTYIVLHSSVTLTDVQGAEEMAQMEHLLNVYASRAAKGSIADFVGYIEVNEDEATTKLTQGIWLVRSVCPCTIKAL